MADLDDFFAKKDKKKPKGKKFTTTEELAKKLEERKTDKPKKEKITPYQTSVPGQNGEEHLLQRQAEEEEWKEFEEEKKDYTGLKIQNLTLQEEEESENAEGEGEGDMEENELGEMVRKKKGPWKSLDADSATPVTVSAAVITPVAAPAQKAEPPVSEGRAPYILPHLRNASGTTPASRDRPKRGNVGAPDIMNQDFFPTLSAANNETPVSWGRKKQEAAFEEVRNSKSHSNRGDARSAQSLEIGNKFGALQSENS